MACKRHIKLCDLSKYLNDSAFHIHYFISCMLYATFMVARQFVDYMTTYGTQFLSFISLLSILCVWNVMQEACK